MDRVRAREIAEKFAAGACSEAEHEALFKWLLSLPVAESRSLIEEFSGIFEALQAVPARKDLWEKIYQKLDEPKEAEMERTFGTLSLPVHSRFQRKWMFAAASVLIVLTAGFYFIHHKKSAPSVVRQANQDVAPGGNKATLTLADGTTIALDSARDGQLARQGKTEVVKLSNGQLVYDASRYAAAAGDHSPMTYNIITTPKGGQYQLTLSDGSKVWLNSASSLKFPTIFKGKGREVELSGEGYFEIGENAKMPFTVAVNKMKVQVLGTRFDIMAYGDESTVNTTLLQGALRVAKGNLVKRLVPGQQAVLNISSNELAVQEADIQKVMAWKNGVFEFDNADMPAIMRQLSRWYDIEVQYKAKAGAPELGGSISKKLNLSQVLNLLEKNGINHFTMEGKKVTVLP